MVVFVVSGNASGALDLVVRVRHVCLTNNNNNITSGGGAALVCEYTLVGRGDSSATAAAVLVSAGDG